MGRGAEDQSHREILAGPLTQKPGMIFFADTLFRSDSSSGPVCKELSLNNRILSLSLFLPISAACRTPQARDRTHDRKVTTPDPQHTRPSGNSLILCLFFYFTDVDTDTLRKETAQRKHPELEGESK